MARHVGESATPSMRRSRMSWPFENQPQRRDRQREKKATAQRPARWMIWSTAEAERLGEKGIEQPRCGLKSSETMAQRREAAASILPGRAWRAKILQRAQSGAARTGPPDLA